MKISNILALILLIGSALGFADQHKYLVRVDDLTGHDYPIVEIVENHYLMVAGEQDIARLNENSIPYQILDADAGSGVYYLIYLFDESAETVGQFGVVLDHYEDCVLVKTTEENIPELNGLKVELNRLSTKPINVFSPIIPPQPDFSRAPDTLIQKMVAAVSQDSVRASILRMQRMYTRYCTTDSNKIVLVNWLRDKLISYGCDSVYFEYFDSNYGPNVVGVRRGDVDSNWNHYCVIGGHIDDVPSSGYAPGADDNATGTTAMLEAARVMKSYRFENTVRFIGFNAEELGLYGSDFNATQAHANGDTILGVLNFDMIGYVASANRDTMNAHYTTAVPGCSLFVCQWFQAVADTYTQLKIRRVRNTGTSGSSDHASYWAQGYKALLGIERVLCPGYHTTADSIGPYGVNNIPFAAKVIQTGTAALAKLAVPIHSGVGVDEHNAVSTAILLSVQPNPSTGQIVIQYVAGSVGQGHDPAQWGFSLAGSSKPEGLPYIKIFDASGRLVRQWDNQTMRQSAHIVWDCSDDAGIPLPSGVYFIKLVVDPAGETPGITRIEKAVLLR